MAQTTLPSLFAADGLNSAKHEFEGSPITPLTINTPQFGERWGSFMPLCKEYKEKAMNAISKRSQQELMYLLPWVGVSWLVSCRCSIM